MNRTQLLAALREECPVAFVPYKMPMRTGLVPVDLVNGFCSPGFGALAPPARDPRIEQMIDETDVLARRFIANEWPIFAFCDTHDRSEPPFPDHCFRGTGEEKLVPKLLWLEMPTLQRPSCVTIWEKDCINGFVGATMPDGSNAIVEWVNDNQLEAIVVVGICTDICDLDFVVTMLSARNHGMMPTLKDIVVYEPATATYDLPQEVAASLGLPATAAHPQAITHHIGLYTMQSRGAIIADKLEF